MMPSIDYSFILRKLIIDYTLMWTQIGELGLHLLWRF
ncbi:hypothetical protein AALP_AA1G189400 [Arabis alpina]|uniref:Uncharacterized protein n=1 Tax=Arabis alpina TaxID=50452 RepID=A0A087HP54_ARAAL|nr:hypothetical protein AALP_AA1G189400 [Arabis alpina]